MSSQAQAVEPVQARARATRELLIAAAADLLGEIGVERLSSNLICARAGVTPPAFYRYFKDKYAILHVLGERLMEAQNAVVEAQLAREMTDISEDEIYRLILDSIAVTRRFPGGAWVLRALRAVPALQHVRLQSHRKMAALLAKAARRGGRVSAKAALQARLLVDMGYAAIELAFDEPRLKREALARESAKALAGLATSMLAEHG